ncbi:MAG: NUDIX hydrolase [Verrucomicrobia bacterium]|nr:NUDIX hydrolase [Verrucomicrobiota bacterium]
MLTARFFSFKTAIRHPVRDICGDFYVINARPWAVTLALTPQDELVLVQQFRFGVDELSWELPAGCVDEGEDPLKAGVRELLEESGYVGDNPRVIGQSWPNPALQNNTCTFVLVENARCLTAQSPDLHEELAVRTLPVNQVLEWARTGIIRHAMVHNALFYFEPWFRARGA